MAVAPAPLAPKPVGVVGAGVSEGGGGGDCNARALVGCVPVWRRSASSRLTQWTEEMDGGGRPMCPSTASGCSLCRLGTVSSLDEFASGRHSLGAAYESGRPVWGSPGTRLM